MDTVRILALVVLLLGVVAVVIGGVFIGLGVIQDNNIKTDMRSENVTLANLGVEGAPQGNVIDSMAEAQRAADTIREHRKGIASSYEDLLGGGRYDPTNPRHLTYTQALNLENYLYLGVAALGLTQVVTASGVFMVVTGLALAGAGLALNRLGRRLPKQ